MQTLRRFGIAALVVAAGLLMAPAAQALDPKLLPNDTEVVININLKQLLDSPLAKGQKDSLDMVKAMLAAKLEDNPLGKYVKQTGFDVFKDLHSVTIANNGGKDTFFAAVEGKFDVDKIIEAVEDVAKNSADTIKVTKAGKRKILEFSKEGEKTVFASLVSGKLLLACSSREDLDNGLARVDETKKSELKKEFKTLLETTNDKQSMSFVATGNAIGKMVGGAQIPNADAVNMALQGMDGVSLAITVAKDVQFQLGVNAKDEENAKKMALIGNASLKFVTVLVAQKAKEDEKLAPIVDIAKTLRITSQGSNVLIRGEATVEVIERLIKNLPNQ